MSSSLPTDFQGFVPIPSRVEGIEVYAPAPPETPEEKTRTFKCSRCGGSIVYNPSQRQLTCPYCGESQELSAEEIGQAAVEFEFTLEALEQAQYGWGLERRELVCDACGATVAIRPDALTSTCAFCGSHRVHARDVTGDMLRPTALIPFAIAPEELPPLISGWLGRGWMHPPELREALTLRNLIGVYLPFWTLDARVTADWKAEVGTARTTRHYDGEKWVTRTVIDWRWRSGRVRLSFNDHLVAATSRISRRILDRVLPFDLSKLVQYEPGYLAGWQAKGYDVPLQEGWRIGREEMREQAKRACYDDAGSPYVRNFRMAADFADERWRYVLLPFYLASYTLGGRIFHLVINGQTGKVGGQKPVAWLRVWLVIAAMLTPGACLGMLGLMTLLVGGAGAVFLIVGLILLFAAFAGAVYLLARARESEGL